MAKQEVDIGVEGNDGTGDSIRESFRKVNDNFSELYAVFGLGGDISFTNLDDTPNTLANQEGKVVLVKPDGSGLEFFELVSNSGNNNPQDPGNTINFEIVGDQLKVSTINTRLGDDPTPETTNPLKASGVIAYSPTVQSTLVSNIDSLVNNFNTTHGVPFVSSDNIVISKGYADTRYIPSTGGTLTGPLNLPVNSTGAQAIRADEAVSVNGDVMTGALELYDHPAPLQGAGRPNGQDDLQAVTKLYVDSASSPSSENLYVSNQGSDVNENAPAGYQGRSPKYAFASISAACVKAARMQQASAPDLGPYVMDITHQASGVTTPSYVYTSDFGYATISSDQINTLDSLKNDKQDIIDEVIFALNNEYPTFVYTEATCRRDLGLILDSIRFDVNATNGTYAHNYMTRYAGLRYYENPSSEKSISDNGYYTQTIFSTQSTKTAVLSRLETILGSTNNFWYQTVENLFDDLLVVLDQDTPDPDLVESDIYYTIRIYSGANKYTDQAGDPTADKINTDIIPGKAIRGKTSGAIGEIVSYARGVDSAGSPDYDIVRLKMVSPVEFSLNEELEYGNLVNEKQISIRLETGIYYEQLPIRVPQNVSIKGEEFRRSIIRPAPGISTSSAANTYFYRDAEIDGLTTATGGEQVIQGDLEGYFGYHYLTDPTRPVVANPNDPNYNPPKNNNQMDVFLCNDATIFRNITVQRHGGFMMVLDPEGQILTRSPYAQTCTSFSQSANKKAFRGGIFIDGYTYSMPMTITGKTNNFKIEVEAPATSGLGIRKPNTPCSFFIDGIRYQVNSVVEYQKNVNGFALATLILDESSGDGQGYINSVDSPGGAEDIVLQGAGNRSILANDFTQINDLGYGVVATNNALSEIVSVFTYYCHTGYYARNGSEIRSLTGNNSYGNFGLVAEGSDPDESAKPITLSQNTTQPVKAFTVEQILVFTGDITANLSAGEQIKQTIDGTEVKGNIAFFYLNGSGDTEIYVQEVEGDSFVTEEDLFESDSTNLGQPVSIETKNYDNKPLDTSIYIFDVTDYPLNASEFEIIHQSGLQYQYDIVSASDTTIELPASQVANFCGSSNTELRAKIWQLSLNIGIAESSLTGLREQIKFGDIAQLRAKQNILIDGLDANTLTRPSTALIFDNSPLVTYRTVAFENTITGSILTEENQTRITFDSNFEFSVHQIENERAPYIQNGTDYLVQTVIGDPVAGGISIGGNQGDQNIAVTRITDSEANVAIGRIFTWIGKLHRITGVTQVQDTSGIQGLQGNNFSIITFEDVYNNVPNVYNGTGIVEDVTNITDNTWLIRAGLESGAAGEVTINISTCRATSHDFLDIGTGGYNTTNYPNRIYGSPASTAVDPEGAVDEKGQNSKAQVQERVKGRCFFASTDQDGFFRVGRFFTVDQGTGSISFNAALVLNQIDGLGFKRGVPVREFSADETFTNATADTVPVQTAVEGYINRRLGWDRTGNSIDVNDIIGAGAVRKAGDDMTGNLVMNGNQITNLGAPSALTDAANKGYVDNAVQTKDTLSELTDTDIGSAVAGDIIVYDGTATWDAKPLAGDVTLTYDGTSITTAISNNVILNADVNANAGIAQSKLNMQSASTRENAVAIAQTDLGLVSFNSDQFVLTNGWAELKEDGIAGNRLSPSTVANDRLVTDYITFSNGTDTNNTALGTQLNIEGVSNEIDVTLDSSGNFQIGISANINVGSSSNVILTERSTNASDHFLTFAANTSGGQQIYTDSSLKWQPTANKLDIGGGTIVDTIGLTFSGTTGVNKITVPTNVADALTIVDNASTPVTVLTLKTETGNVELDVDGGIAVSGNILPNVNTPTDSGQDIGGVNNKWNTIYATTFSGTATEALYADLAENYLGDADYEPGTVVVFGGDEEVTLCTAKGQTSVAGVVTTNPAHLMNSALEGDHVVGLALQGRVPCKVLGTVNKGDMLVTSAVPGYAIVNNSPGIGQVIGKAVGTKTDDGKGTVEVVVGRV